MGEFKRFLKEESELGKLTPELKARIDAMDYEQLLRKWRFAPAGDPLFVGETGDYYSKRMKALRNTVDHVAASKHIGWEKDD
jgi:hypothetical protein